MKKIISLFQRNYDGDRLVRNEIVPGAEWVAAGEGRPTRKFDGSACMIRDGQIFKRYNCKPGKTSPQGWEPCVDGPDPNTGHFPGWVMVGNGPEDEWYREALENSRYQAVGGPAPFDGTYEACGPHFQGNPEQFDRDRLVLHGAETLLDCPRDFDGLRSYFETHNIEGIVWHHPDGRMVKIKSKDFGVNRKK